MRANNRRTYLSFALLGSIWTAYAVAQPVPNFSGQPATPAIIPTAPAISPAPTLQYRDPSKLMTIGEVSDLQAAKASAEYVSKFGYTDQKPLPSKPVRTTKLVAERSRLTVSVLAGWSRSNKAQVEALVDGRFTTLHGGEILAPGVVVEEVRPSMLVLSVQSMPSKSTKRVKQPMETRRYSLRVGAQSEIEL
jgi:hypothetical protein